jgi:uncharacterized protein (TIGR02646 family)
MIKIDKGLAPEYLKSDTLDLAIEKLDEFYGAKNRNQKRYNFPFNSDVDGSLKTILHELFNGKCGYCEKKIELPYDGVIDRFRPHNGVRDKNKYFQDLYWWLVFDWDNLVYSCIDCNQYKANYFPIKGKRAMSKTDDLANERKLLLSPCIDEPRNHFTFSKGEINSETDEGLQTIELLRLNRTSLVNDRNKAIYEIRKIISRASNNSSQEFDYINQIFDREPHIEYLFAKHSVLLEELDSNPFFRKYIKNDEDQYEDFPDELLKQKRVKRRKIDIVKSDYFPLEYMHIKNFKSITDLKIDFPEDVSEKRAWLFFLGENGVGKSTILQALALGIKSKIKDGDYIVSNLIQKNKQKAEIIIKERNSDNLIITTIIRKDKSIVQKGRFNSFLLGYGSLRLPSEEGIEKEQNLKAVSYENLFNPIKSLNDSTNWLKNIFKTNRKLFDSIAFSIKELLPDDLEDRLLTVNHNEVVFENSEIPFTNFSDGYKSTITLAIDIMMKLSSGHADMDKISGIVIIDELGNQLHPRWQMRIVKQLRSVFPRITFIISTHHPLCLRGSNFGEVVLLKKIENRVEVIRELPDPSALRVDQLLSSEYFGLSSLIDPELEAKFNRYYQLLSLGEKISSVELKELNGLKDELRDKKHLGSSLREELMYCVIDNLLAQKVMFSKDIPNREKLKKEAIERVREIWSKLNILPNDQS